MTATDTGTEMITIANTVITITIADIGIETTALVFGLMLIKENLKDAGRKEIYFVSAAG